MTSRNAVVYGVGGLLLAACLAAANMPQEADVVSQRTRAPRVAGPDALAAEVSSQASRLRTLMAQAPMPVPNSRNPFSFAARAARVVPAPSSALAAGSEPAPVAPAPLPALTLMGIAEDTTPAGPRRTAVIAEGETIYMVAEGEAVGERYRVTRIGADAIELEDIVSKAYRRLA